MRILVAHNFYQLPGGEDQVFRSELALLASRGHDVASFEMHNDEVRAMGKLSLLRATVWNRDAARRLREKVRAHRAEVVHFHNTFPLMSPAAYYAARGEGAVVVQTLHNFRPLCPAANFYRDSKVCETCLGRRVALPAIRHKCYRGSTGATAVTVAMLGVHRAIGTWHKAVDAFITPTKFVREKFIEGGFPAEKIHAKPNFLDPDPGVGPGGGGFALFVGRLSREKGLDTLVAAWDRLGEAAPPLKIAGDGPLADDVKAAVARNPKIEWLGWRKSNEVLDLVGRAEFLVFPSGWYETFGNTAMEAFARGTPVIASGHGAPAELVEEGRVGVLFRPGDSGDLAEKVRGMLSDRARLAEMRTAARAEFEARYTAGRNYDLLMAIYQAAGATVGSPASGSATAERVAESSVSV
jgi:glycosyltransferase involved in cell wall biosynthesis